MGNNASNIQHMLKEKAQSQMWVISLSIVRQCCPIDLQNNTDYGHFVWIQDKTW